MNYTKYYQYEMSQRIKDYLEENKGDPDPEYMGAAHSFRRGTQSELSFDAGIEVSDLSAIINGKIRKKRSSFMTSKEAGKICGAMGMGLYDFVWGTEEEREVFVKLILIAILANGAKTCPLRYDSEPSEDFFDWADKQQVLTKELRTEISIYREVAWMFENYPSESRVFGEAKKFASKEEANKEREARKAELHHHLVTFFSEKYGFFYNKRNYEGYTRLCGSYAPKLEYISNHLLRHHLLSYPKLAESFLRRFAVRTMNSSTSPSRARDAIGKYLRYRGRYGDLLLDYGEYDYCLFVNAFMRFWVLFGNSYCGYFNRKIFSLINQNVDLKNFKDKKFSCVIEGNHFLRFVQNNTIPDEYGDPEWYQVKKLEEEFLHHVMDSAFLRTDMAIADNVSLLSTSLHREVVESSDSLGLRGGDDA